MYSSRCTSRLGSIKSPRATCNVSAPVRVAGAVLVVVREHASNEDRTTIGGGRWYEDTRCETGYACNAVMTALYCTEQVEV